MGIPRIAFYKKKKKLLLPDGWLFGGWKSNCAFDYEIRYFFGHAVFAGEISINFSW